MSGPQVLAYAACVVSGSLWFVFLYFNPYTTAASFPPADLGWTPATRLIVWIQIVLSAGGAVAAWRMKPYLMYLVFLMTFTPFGLYVSLSGRVWAWIGVAQLAYLAAAMALHRSSYKSTRIRKR